MYVFCAGDLVKQSVLINAKVGLLGLGCISLNIEKTVKQVVRSYEPSP